RNSLGHDHRTRVTAIILHSTTPIERINPVIETMQVQRVRLVRGINPATMDPLTNVVLKELCIRSGFAVDSGDRLQGFGPGCSDIMSITKISSLVLTPGGSTTNAPVSSESMP